MSDIDELVAVWEALSEDGDMRLTADEMDELIRLARLGAAVEALCQKYCLEATPAGVGALGCLIEYERDNAAGYKAALTKQT